MRSSEPSQPVPRRALRVHEARAALGIGKTTIFALLKTGQLASVRVGTVRLIPVEAIDAMLAGRPGRTAPMPEGTSTR